MRPQPDTAALHPVGEAAQIALERVEIDQQRRGVDLVERHADFGGRAGGHVGKLRRLAFAPSSRERVGNAMSVANLPRPRFPASGGSGHCGAILASPGDSNYSAQPRAPASARMGGNAMPYRARFAATRLAALFAAMAGLLTWPHTARAAEPLTIGFDISLTGGIAPNGKAALLAMQIWARTTQRQGRVARPAGEADHLRRPEQSRAGARDRHQAARRGQGRYPDRRQRHQRGGAGDAGRDAAQPDVLSVCSASM